MFLLMRVGLNRICPQQTIPCPHSDARRPPGHLSVDLNLPLSLQQHLDLSLQEAQLSVLMEEQLVGVRRYDPAPPTTVLSHTVGTGERGGVRRGGDMRRSRGEGGGEESMM